MLISKQWSLLRPEIIDNTVVEKFNDYYHRITGEGKFDHIPREVFEQWIHENYLSEISTKNYGWLNYEEVKFELINLTIEDILRIKVVKSLRDSIVNDNTITSIEAINCKEADLNFWIKNGTWRVPPIILDVDSLQPAKIPRGCELYKPFQLVEGYTRLRNFHSIYKINKPNRINLAESHLVYRMFQP